MKKKYMFSTSLVLLSLLGLMTMFFGCEDEPSMSPLDQFFEDNPFVADSRSTPGLVVDPSEAIITSTNQHFNFTVSGGQEPYSWWATDKARGRIRVLGDTRNAIYESLALADNNVVVADVDGRSAIATIATESAVALRITPSSASLDNGESVTFFASGGTGPYSWKLSNTKGILSTGVGEETTYTRTDATAGESNTIILKDSVGTLISVTVSHN